MDSLVQTVRVFSEDMWMEFGIETCVMLVIEKGKIVKSVGTEFPDGSQERLIVGARRDKIDGLEASSVLKRSKKVKGLEDWEGKVLHGQYLRQTKEVRSDQYWTWLQNGDLKRKTGSFIMAAQNQSVRKNLV